MDQDIGPTQPPSAVYETIIDAPRYTEIPTRGGRGTVPQSPPDSAYSEVTFHGTALPSTVKLQPPTTAVPSLPKGTGPAKSKLRKQYSDPLQPRKVVMRHHTKSRPNKSHSLSLHEDQMPNYCHDSATYSLPELVNKYSSSLPLRVMVKSGMCTNIEDGDNISTGESYNIHFLKYTKVVHISTQSSHMYVVPLNSAVRFGLVYNPHDNLREALEGLMFKSVSELLEAKPLPKIIRATKSYLGGANSSVVANEILLVIKPSKLKVVGFPLLRVYSLTKQKKKALHPQCTGHFTTSPKGVSLCLPDILQHLPDTFPFDVVAHSHAEDLPKQLTMDVVTLTHSSIETSIISSLCMEEESDRKSIFESSLSKTTILDIPLGLDIDVSVSRLNELEEQNLNFTTRELYESFQSSKVKTCLLQAASSEAFAIQSQLLSLVQENNAMVGIELEKPEKAYTPHRFSSAMLSTHIAEVKEENAIATPPLPPRADKSSLPVPSPAQPSLLAESTAAITSSGGEASQRDTSCEKQETEESTSEPHAAGVESHPRLKLSVSVPVELSRLAGTGNGVSQTESNGQGAPYGEAHPSTADPKHAVTEKPAALPQIPPRPPKPALPPRPPNLPKRPKLPLDDETLGRPLPKIPRSPELPSAAYSDEPIYIIPGDNHNYQPLTSSTVGTLPAYASVQPISHSSESSESSLSQQNFNDEASSEKMSGSTDPEGRSKDLMLNAQVDVLKERIAALECSKEELASEVSSLRSDVAKVMQLVESFTQLQKQQEIEREQGESRDERLSAAESAVSKQEHNQQYLASLSSSEV